MNARDASDFAGADAASSSGERTASAGVIRIGDKVLMQRAADELVFLSLVDNSYYGLEPIGTRMVELLLEYPTVDEVVGALELEYATTADVLHRDVRQLVGDLVSSGLVEVVVPMGDPPATGE
jgi:hypothetical protein